VVPLPPLKQALLRYALVFAGVPKSAHPKVSKEATLSREPGEDPTGAGAFYYRDALAGPFEFSGVDFQRLYALETSADRCQNVGFLLEARPHVYAPWQRIYTGTFTCNECSKWNPAACTVTVTPVTDDAYRLFLENYEREFNILDCPTTRVSVQAQLATLASGITIEFKRIDQDEQADYVGTDAWTLFYTNNSQIYRPIAGPATGQAFQANHDVLIFRYLQRAVPYVNVASAGSTPVYVMLDRSSTGWSPVLTTANLALTPPTVDYVKEPAIAGFKPYKLTGYGDNTPFYRTEGDGKGKGIYLYGSTAVVSGAFSGGLFSSYAAVGYALGAEGAAPQYGGYLGEFLSLNIGKKPSDYGYLDSDYVSIYDTAGALNARVNVDSDQQRALFWKFGNFRFGRCFPLRDALYSLLSQTLAAYGNTSLLPPTADKLSDFLTNPLNPATGDTGTANEVPRLLVSAASDVKRYGASEAATRLLISLKQLLADLSTLYNAGWFVDPATGWLRFEHRVYLETSVTQQLDLRDLPEVLFPGSYDYRLDKLARFEELDIAGANTEDLTLGLWFGKSIIDYGLGGCVNQREGQNRVSLSSARLTGDVAAMVLNSDSVPDSALALLAPDPYFKLPNANREVAATNLQLRYWRWGRAAYGATVEGPAPPVPANTPPGTIPVTGVPLQVVSVRPQRVQTDILVPACSLADFTPVTRYTTNLGGGAQLGKATLPLLSGGVKLTVWLPVPVSTTPAPIYDPHDFSDPFTADFS
jgi:hypothetical protein